MSGWYTSVSRLAGLLYNLLGLFLMFQAYLFLLTAAADAVRLVARAKTAPPRLATAIILASVLLVLAGHIMARRLSITETEIAVKGLPAPVAIVHAPDLHLGAQRGAGWLQRTIAAINDLKPDLVIYNGDLADSNVALTERIFGLFKEVSAPQYYTTGNHEYYIDTERALALAKGAGLIVLRNQAVETAGLQLAGLEYMNADRETNDAHMVNSLTIEEELPKLGLDPDRPIVVIHHSPVGLEYVQKAGADVMLSGHTHGGQVFPGTLLIRQRFPYFKGFYQAGPTALLVSQGAGTFGPWMRLGSFSEIQLVRLVPAK
jgi:predicted MPP superfamily phosphohydrolase